jgi:hypothetical protein
MLPQIAYVTHGGDPSNPDIPLAIAAFANAGMQATTVSWNDDAVRWDGFDLVLVGPGAPLSGQRQEFLRWARGVEDRGQLANPAVALARSTDLTYLRDLHGRGIETLDTIWLEPGDAATDIEQRLQLSGWARFVVAPSVVSGRDQPRFADSPREAAQVAAQFAARGCAGLIRPDLAASPAMAIMIIDGRISHAVARATATDPWSRREVDPAIVDLVDHVLAVATHGEDLLYARLDLVAGADGWLVEQLEAAAPTMFLEADAHAADRLAWAIRDRITGDLRPGSPAGSD